MISLTYQIEQNKPHGGNKMKNYEVQGRNGYWAIDLYENDRCLRLVEIFKTKKQAERVAGELNQAIAYGLENKDTKTVIG